MNFGRTSLELYILSGLGAPESHVGLSALPKSIGLDNDCIRHGLQISCNYREK